MHNFDRDLHIFVLWEKSGHLWDEIIIDLTTRFQIVHRTSVVWSVDEVENNFLRLYGMPPIRDSAKLQSSTRSSLVGGGPFMVLVVEDLSPVYIYDRTFSKKIELVNRNISQAKAYYRELAGGGIKVHSSNSLGEFFRDATLLLGADCVDKLIMGRCNDLANQEILRTDLAGGGGWSSLRDIFRHLFRSSDYVILRNYDDLCESVPSLDTEIDVLCRDPADFASIVNGQVVSGQGTKFSCEALVGENKIYFDVRFIGDGYYDERWADHILCTAQRYEYGIMIPTFANHFFSLLYHAKLHKREVSERDLRRLNKLAPDLGLTNYQDVDVTSDEHAAGILAGFLRSRGYRCSAPLDSLVAFNGPFAILLRGASPLWSRERERDRRQVDAILARTPLLWRVRSLILGPLTAIYRALRKYVYRSL